MKRRVLLAGLYHETNTFLPEQTSLAAFARLEGKAIRQAEGDGSPLAGALEAARALDWEIVPAIDLRAMPGGTVTDVVVETFWQSFLTALPQDNSPQLDAIFLVLHGAMVSETYTDVEGEILRRIRACARLRELPIGGVLDLHANVTAEMARNSNLLVAYRENPHTDAHATTVRAAQLLDRALETDRVPQTLRAHPPLMWPPTGTATADEPMRTLEARAREIEDEDEAILAVNVLAGFSFADTPQTGVSFTVVTQGDTSRAEAYLQELCCLAMANRAVGNRQDMDLQDALRLLPRAAEKPTLLVEPSDNIGAGSPGDTTGLLRALLENDIENAGVILNDPLAVQQLARLPLGGTMRLDVGGKSGVVGAEPLTLEVTLVSRHPGRFRLEDPASHAASMFGEQVDMGPCAVMQCRGVTLLLTSRKTPPFDLAQWRSQGIAPERFQVIAIKAAVAHRQAYAPIAGASFTVDTPGPCSSNLQTLPYRRVQRPLFPLDAIQEAACGAKEVTAPPTNNPEEMRA